MPDGPGLSRDVAQVLNLDTDFLAHFAMDAILDRFAGFDESGERAVDGLWEALRAREQKLPAARDQHHHRRRDARPDDMSACRTFLGPLAFSIACRRAAAPAEVMAAVPFDDL